MSKHMQIFCLTLLSIMIFNILSAFALTQYKVELLMISDISQAETVRQDGTEKLLSCSRTMKNGLVICLKRRRNKNKNPKMRVSVDFQFQIQKIEQV